MKKFVSHHVTDNGEAVETHSALPRVISYIPYGEIFVEQQSGGWQSPYLFNAKELDSETGLYYYGARYLDPTSAAWLSVDPLFEKYVGMSPYGYCAGNPVRLVDVDGNFSIAYTDEDLESYNLTKDEMGRFESLIKNIGNIVNEEALSEISKTTGLSIDEIKKNMNFGEGPQINLTDGGSYCNGNDIYINVAHIKDLASTSATEQVSGKSYSKLELVSFLSAMEILHEYGHYGDQKTNGTNTGQWIKNIDDVNYDKGMNSKDALKKGSQTYQQTKTGHRGDDVTYCGFGVCIIENSRKKLQIHCNGGRYDPVKTSKTLNKNILKKLGIK